MNGMVHTSESCCSSWPEDKRTSVHDRAWKKCKWKGGIFSM